MDRAFKVHLGEASQDTPPAVSLSVGSIHCGLESSPDPPSRSFVLGEFALRIPRQRTKELGCCRRGILGSVRQDVENSLDRIGKQLALRSKRPYAREVCSRYFPGPSESDR